MRLIFLFLIFLGLLFPVTSLSVTALHYNTFAVADIEAYVEKICLAGVPTLKTDEFMLKRPMKESVYIREVQKISLKIKKIKIFEKRGLKVSPVVEGETIEATNPFTDQKPPFKVGDRIKVRVRLVLPEEEYNSMDPRLQWWFFPIGEKEDIFPPRHPFKEINVME